ncbi:phage recombination protein Bet [Halalkalibacter krulwichiae]|uniref:RecT family protein n=1 Tax=Halalkalibacter krulwichiae TaxID=199441 RepID=A0A1X9MFE9_9BACI|nr:phage recombination protein Bet [Halalkalibacter krulwichiae]ARK32168.1 RecT family protein [Halalkalibacter krulwichiae]
MTNALVKAISYEVSGEVIDLQPETVKNYLVRGNGSVTDQEIVMFMNLCQYQKLNPLINEAYLIKFGSQPAQIIVSKEAFMKRAESNEKFEGFEAGIIYEFNDEIKQVIGAVKPKKAELIGGWCKVFRSDRKQPIEVQVSIDEFSKGQATWKDMPLNMIRKVAIVNALREAFPNSLGAMYTEEEANKSSDIPEYQPKERKDITPNEPPAQSDQEVVKSPIDEAKAKMQSLFAQLGIEGKEAKGEYISKNLPNASNPPTLQELTGLIAIMEMDLERRQSFDADELE